MHALVYHRGTASGKEMHDETDALGLSGSRVFDFDQITAGPNRFSSVTVS
jgi:hypothetical protein